jgi:hypothetical protein
MNSNWGKGPYIEYCCRKERGGEEWLLAGVWKLKGIRKKSHKGRCLLSLGEEDLKYIYIYLNCLETSRSRTGFLNEKWLKMNEGDNIEDNIKMY